MSRPRPSRTAGFVPIELLAIVAVLFLLVGIALPLTSRFKSKSASTICVSNHKQVVVAWQIYANEHEGKTANNFIIPSTMDALIRGTFDNWANNIMTWSANGIEGVSVTNQALAGGTLNPYTSGDAKIYRCPSDNFLSPAQRARGWKYRSRTMAMNALIGRTEHSSNGPTAGGRSWMDSSYRQWLKVGDIPQPATTWVTIDEHPDSVNDGFFVISIGSGIWADLPGALHGSSTTFSFADAHVETRKWRTKRLNVPVRYNFPTVTIDAEGRKDFAWYKENLGLVRY
ncbi:MAG TPA: hypothetical protein VF773_01105 [Verrucomicrobiae bacterium]